MSISSLLVDVDIDSSLNDAHLLSRNPPNLQTLSRILDHASEIQNSLLSHAVLEPDQRLRSLFKEYTEHTISMEIAKSDAKTREEILGPTNRPHLYGEDVPYSRASLPEYVITRLEASTSAAGLDVYKDEENVNTVFICGGKVLVLDITLLNHTRSGLTDASMPTISLTSLKISHAPPADDTPAQASLPSDTLLSALLASDVDAFILECHTQNPVADSKKVALLLNRFKSHLEYLVHLDGIAAEAPEGARWLREIGLVAADAETITQHEAKAVAACV